MDPTRGSPYQFCSTTESRFEVEPRLRWRADNRAIRLLPVTQFGSDIVDAQITPERDNCP